MQSFRFPRSSRILNRADFLKFFKDSERFRAGLCLVFRRKSNRAEARLGITLKIRGSVLRNALKRQIRESFRIVRADLPAYDYNVVIPKLNTVDHKTATSVRQSMDRFWAKEKI